MSELSKHMRERAQVWSARANNARKQGATLEALVCEARALEASSLASDVESAEAAKS